MAFSIFSKIPLISATFASHGASFVTLPSSSNSAISSRSGYSISNAWSTVILYVAIPVLPVFEVVNVLRL